MAADTRLGMITPSSNTCLEPVSVAALRESEPAVSVHFSRVQVTAIGLGSRSSAQFATEPMLAAAQLLADAEISALAWAGTSGSWLGIEHDLKLAELMQRKTGVPTTTSTLAIIDALQHLEVERFGLAVPYTEDVANRIVETYERHGFRCAGVSALGISRNFDFDQVDPERLTELLAGAAREADAIAVVCTNLRAGPLVSAAERELGVPIVDSVLATVWRLLRLSGLGGALHGWGQLLATVKAR